MDSTSVSLLFNTIPKHIDSLAATWNKFKNSTVVETELLHQQPFLNSHLHSPVTVKLAICKALLQNLKQIILNFSALTEVAVSIAFQLVFLVTTDSR